MKITVVYILGHPRSCEGEREREREREKLKKPIDFGFTQRRMLKFCIF